MLKFRVHRGSNFTNMRKSYDDIVAWLDDNVHVHFASHPASEYEQGEDPALAWLALVHNHSVIFGQVDASETMMHIEYVLGKRWRASFVTVQKPDGTLASQVAYHIDDDENGLLELQLKLMFL
jgi:hypothetical protein